MGEERIGIVRFHDMRGVFDRRRNVAVAAQIGRRRSLGEFGGAQREALAALGSGRTFVPGHFQFVARAVRRPKAFRHDGDAIAQSLPVAARIGLARPDDESVVDSGQRLDGVDIRADQLAAEDRTFLKDGVQHARHGDVDAEQRLAAHDFRIIDAGNRPADDLEVFRIFKRHAREIGHRHAGGLGGKRAIGERAAAVAVIDHAGFRAAFRRRDIPGLRGGSDKHLAAGCADPAQRIVVQRRRPAAAGKLLAVFGGVERRLLDSHILPRNIEFFGDHHRQHGLDALADLRILRHDGDDAVGRDADKGVQRGGFAGGFRGCRHCGARQRRQGGLQQQTAACRDSGLQKRAPRMRGGRRQLGLGRFGGGVGGHHGVHHHLTVVAPAGASAACLIAARMRV